MNNQPDPIVEEIHETRRKLAERFQFDARQISEDAKRRQLAEGRPVYVPRETSEGLESANETKKSSKG